MEERGREKVWRIWVSAELRVVSFHPEKGWQMLEFHDYELFCSCIERYTAKRYHYQ